MNKEKEENKMDIMGYTNTAEILADNGICPATCQVIDYYAHTAKLGFLLTKMNDAYCIKEVCYGGSSSLPYVSPDSTEWTLDENNLKSDFLAICKELTKCK